MCNMILQEVYFGKSSGLIKAEKALGEYRAKYMNEYRDPRCKSDPSLKKYCKIMEDEFGFGCFAVDIELVEVTNAMTLPVGKAIDLAPQCRLKKNLIVDSSGYKYRKEADYYYYMSVFSGLIFNPEFTDEEVQAVIMHEVGHNFYTVSNSFALYTSDAIFFTSMIGSIMSNIISGRVDEAISTIMNIAGATNVAKKVNVSISKIVEKSPELCVVVGVVSVFKGALLDLNVNLSTIINWVMGIANIPSRVISNLISYILNPTGYADEKFADNFATMYGYGPDLVSALEKMDAMGMNIAVKKIIRSNPLLNAIDYLYSTPVEIISSVMDPHPYFIERARDQQRYLERELSKSDIDPRMKKRLSDNSKELNNQIDDFVKYKSKLSPKQFEDFNRDYQVFMDALFKGDFRHNIDLPSKNLAVQVDKMYDRIKLV